MVDLKERFRVLDYVPFNRPAPAARISSAPSPGLEIGPRAEGLLERRRRWPVFLVASAAAVAGLLFVWAAFEGSAPLSTTSPTRYTDPVYGWSMSVPTSLRLHSFSTIPMTGHPPSSTAGASVSNFKTEANPTLHGFDSLRSFPAAGVMFMLWRNEGVGVTRVNSQDDTQLPMSLSAFQRINPYVGGSEPIPLFLTMVEGGGVFTSAVWIGPKASESDRRSIEATVRSVTFPALRPFSRSPESGAIVLDLASTYPVGSITPFRPSALRAVRSPDLGSPLEDWGFYLVHGPHGFYIVPMKAQGPHRQRCHVSADPSNVSFSCANGAKWDRYVHAVARPANDSERRGYWLFASPATISGDGHVLVSGGNDPESALHAWRAGPST